MRLFLLDRLGTPNDYYVYIYPRPDNTFDVATGNPKGERLPPSVVQRHITLCKAEYTRWLEYWRAHPAP